MRKWVFAAVCLLLVPWVGTVAWVWAGTNAGNVDAGEKNVRDRSSGRKNDEARSLGKKNAEELENSDVHGDAAGEMNGKLGLTESSDSVNLAKSVNVAESGASEDAAVRQRWVILDGREKAEYRRLEDYLPGVVACQMPDTIDGGSYDPEVWKCQAVIARSYICYLMVDQETIHEEELDLDYPGEKQELLASGNDRAVRKLELAEEAVAATSGVVMKYEDHYILPMFHEISAGQTRTGAEEFPYLQSVKSSQDVKREEYRTEMTFSAEEFATKITRITDGAAVKASELPSAIQTIRRDTAGYMEQMQIGAATYTGDEIRYSLGLPSSHFTIEAADDGIRVVVQGRGHGYGLSQAGADSLARDDWTYEDILKYYYKNIEVVSE
jgi:stage II sporulation protein D